jgi:hypothetical protein
MLYCSFNDSCRCGDKSGIMEREERSAEVFLPDEPADGQDNFLAKERGFDRKLLWRMAFWASSAISALIIAFLVVQYAANFPRHQKAADTTARQTQNIAQMVRDSRNEARRLAAAIETLNHDRDRLFTRVAALEHNPNLTGVTGAVAPSAPVPSPSPPLPAVQLTTPVSLTGAPPRGANAEPQPSPAKDATVIGGAPNPWAVASTLFHNAATPSAIALRHTEFGIDLGAGPSLAVLRKLWGNAAKAYAAELTALHPVIVVREAAGGHASLHLVVGPLRDAADAARLCAVIGSARQPCTPTVFEGQRLALSDGTAPSRPALKPRPRPKVEGALPTVLSAPQPLPGPIRP